MERTLPALRAGDWREPDLIARAVRGPAALRGDRRRGQRAGRPASARQRPRSAPALPDILRASPARKERPRARRAAPALPLRDRPPRRPHAWPARARRGPATRESANTPEPVDT